MEWRSIVTDSLLGLHWNQVPISKRFEIFGYKYIGVTTLTFHVTI